MQCLQLHTGVWTPLWIQEDSCKSHYGILSLSRPLGGVTCSPKEEHPTLRPPSCFCTPKQIETLREVAPASRQNGCCVITCDTRHPGNILSLSGAVATLLPAPARCRPSGPNMDFTHFEEGHHERLFVIRAISAYKACFSRIYAETLKSNRKVSVREMVLLDWSIQNHGIPMSSVSFLLGSCSISFITKHSPPATMTYGHFYDSTPSILDKRLHHSTWLFGTPMASLLLFRH